MKEPKSESISRETSTRVEYQYYDENSKPVHLCKVIYKKQPKIIVYPYSYSETRGVLKKRVNEIELHGWATESEVPKILKPGVRIGLTAKQVKPLMTYLYPKYKKFKKLIIRKSGRTRFGDNTITFSFADFENIARGIRKEISIFEKNRKSAVVNSLAAISDTFPEERRKLTKGSISHFLSHHSDDINLSEEDIESTLELLAHMPIGQVSVTENFIQTSTRMNVAYLDNIISEYEKLMTASNHNEKDWQKFFEDHGWILSNIFPFHVILHEREAYVGGKVISDKEARVVDFLFANGFRDNYALLEIKTHNTKLLKDKPYRGIEAFAQHDECAGAIAQCLDQKSTFMAEFGQKLKIRDPKVVLVIGMKKNLTDDQSAAFELLRSNQKNIDIVAFDELYEKLKGLRSILLK